jgi:catechol 2,3-dioxygenase-like lactoylglutathione lyase family enzyme
VREEGSREEVVSVFENARAAAVIAVSDLKRARGFYEGVLGLSVEEDHPETESVIYRVGGSLLMLYVTSYAGTAKNTVFAIDTDDLDRDMTAMRDAGIAFMEYDFPGLKTVDGVAELPGERSAWFEDPDGNALAISERE